MKIYTDKDASMEPLTGRKVAILGYGNQGSAQARNLRDSGADVVVGNRDDSYADQSRADGFETLSIAEAAAVADCALVLTTDESQPLIWDEQIAPGIEAGNTLVWASGYNIAYDLVKPRADVDVVMVAPRTTGSMVRQLFEHGKGAMAQVAVHTDASAKAWDTMMAISKGIGATKGGVFESSFREEAELDLFAEQVVWSGFVAWIRECFELGVEQGFSPELLVLELYASEEASEIFGLMAQHGMFKQMAHHSTTSQFGTLSRAPLMLNDEVRARMRRCLIDDIKGGAFAREWSDEQAGGSQELAKLKEQAFASTMARAEEQVIPLVQQAHSV